MKYLMLLFFSFVCARAVATDHVGSSTGAWVCWDSEEKKTISWIETLDMYEAADEHELTLVDFGNQSQARIVQFLSERFFRLYGTQLPTGLRAFFDAEIKAINAFKKSDKVLIKEEFLVKSSDDEIRSKDFARMKPLLAKYCPAGLLALEQVINYKWDGVLLLQDTLYRALGARPQGVRSQSAVIVHEALYAALRKFFHVQNSIAVRRIVGVLASMWDDEKVRAQIGKTLLSVKNEKKKVIPARFSPTNSGYQRPKQKFEIEDLELLDDYIDWLKHAILAVYINLKTGEVGASWGQRNRETAEQEANGNCGSPDCQLFFSYQGNGCIATVAPSDQPFTATSTHFLNFGESRFEVELKSMEECGRAVGVKKGESPATKCQLLVSICQDRPPDWQGKEK